jgi:hypothetical protein
MVDYRGPKIPPLGTIPRLVATLPVDRAGRGHPTIEACRGRSAVIECRGQMTMDAGPDTVGARSLPGAEAD